MLKKLLRLLNTLPFDGNKTKIGAWLTGLAAIIGSLQAIDPELVQQLIALLTAHPINWGAIAILLLGLLHKYLKNRFPFFGE